MNICSGMGWDWREEWVCRLPDELGGHEARARRHPRGWTIEVPEAGIEELVRNRAYKTWLSAGPVIEVLLRTRLRSARGSYARAPSTPYIDD